MAIESTRDLCLSVADAIREKKGTSELINPQDFAKEIASIEGGGSGGGGGSNVEYLDLSGLEQRGFIAMYSIAVKGLMQGIMYAGVPTPTFIQADGKTTDIVAIMIDLSLVVSSNVEGSVTTMTLRDALSGANVDLDSIPRLTKEQFYDLNA